MSGDDFGRLIYLVLLGCVIAGYFFIQNRHRLGQMAQQASIWALIFVGAIAAIGMWGDIRSTLVPSQAVISEEGRIEVPRGRDGHYYLTLELNGKPVRFMVDTGASDLVLSRDDAERAGIDPGALRYLAIARTANGEVKIARTRLDEVRIGGFVERNVPASVSAGDMPGSLLGMSFLDRFSSVAFGSDLLTLTR